MRPFICCLIKIFGGAIDCFKNCLGLERIVIELDDKIIKQILEKSFSAGFYRKLTFFINLTFQLRNSDSEKFIDYISCPSCGYHSDKGFAGGSLEWGC